MSLRALMAMNPWWTTGVVSSGYPEYTVREEVRDVLAGMNSARILSLVGPRRVGKTVMMMQAIRKLLGDGVAAQRILFFSCDDQALFSTVSTIGDVFRLYEEQVLFETFAELAERIYVFIDEIHVMREWQLFLKNHVDRRENVKFIVSGSSMTQLLHGSRESLMGRVDDIHVLPLSFRQFVFFEHVLRPAEPLHTWLQEVPPYSLFADPAAYAADLMRKQVMLESVRLPIMKLYQTYLLVGGYPEYFEEVPLLFWQQRLLQDIVTRGLFRDIVLQYTIRNPEKLERLLYFVAANAGQPHSWRTLGQTIELDSATVSQYVSYLNDASFLEVLENYSENAGKSIRQNKKLYLGDNGVQNAFLLRRSISEGEAGTLVESDCCHAAETYAARTLSRLYYYRDDKGEVDFVLAGREKPLPVEVKYQRSLKDADFTSLRRFMERFGSKHGVLVSREDLMLENGISVVPAWLV